MKAMLIDENKDLVWTDVADPVIREDEVLVKIRAAALNRADLLQRQGKYPSPPGCPEWMGLEIAGVIEKVGSAVGNSISGDRVCALLGGGGYAEYVAVKEDMLMPIPKGLTMEEAAALSKLSNSGCCSFGVIRGTPQTKQPLPGTVAIQPCISSSR